MLPSNIPTETLTINTLQHNVEIGNSSDHWEIFLNSSLVPLPLSLARNINEHFPLGPKLLKALFLKVQKINVFSQHCQSKKLFSENR